VTFLFTDIEGSTRLWEEHPEAMRGAVARHDELLREAIGRRGGHVFSTSGDGLAAAFSRAGDALAAAIDAQTALGAEPWPQATPLRVRMALHSGEAEERDGDYFGPALNRAARLAAVGHGGQVLSSQVTADLVRDALPDGVGLRDVGEHQLRDLTNRVHVFQVVHPELRAEFPPLRSLDSVPGNLPRQMTSFVGRDREVQRLGALVCERPLVTLTGVGGVGKTRLAVQVAAEVAARFVDGAWLCELAPVADPGAVWEALAATLGVAPAPGRSLDGVVLEYLTTRRLLLVLDNCEHLLASVAGVVSAIARQCRGVVILATSREGLALAGEQMVAVPSLSVPEEGAVSMELEGTEAVRLFCERAHDADATFALGTHNAPAVAQLCRRLDGIPLAIELAAARVRSLPPEDLVARLDQRFRLLTRGSRAALERHQTLRHTLDWSYDLLADPERAGLNRLSVFAGGCDLPAAEAVLGGEGADLAEVADVLGQLVDKSLVVVDHAAHRTRYRLLETIRQYAQERLELSGETVAVRGWHLAHYVALAEAAAPHLRTRDQLAWAAALAADIDNLRAALDYAIEAALPDPALRLVAALSVAGLPIGWTVMGWADVARAIPGAVIHELFPLVVAYAAMDALVHGSLDRASPLVACAEEAQAALGTDHGGVLAAASALAFYQGDLEGARRHAKVGLEQARATGDTHELAHALLLVAAALLDDPGRGTAVAEEAVRVARGAGLSSVLPYALGVYLTFVGADDPELELALHDEIIEVSAALGDDQLGAAVVASREDIKVRQGNWRAALRANADAAGRYRDGGRGTISIITVRNAAMALTALGHFEAGAIVLGFADAQFVRVGSDEYMTYLAEADAALLDALGKQRVTELKARGAALAFPDAIDYLRAEADRALAE
jgi:predicted ATPase/class 3 adenylate cyclase